MGSAQSSTFVSTTDFSSTISANFTRIASPTFVATTSPREEIKRVLKPSARQIANTVEQAAKAESKYRSYSLPTVARDSPAPIPSHIMLPYQTEIITSAYIINTSETAQKLALNIFVKWDELDYRFHNRIVESEGLRTLIQCTKDNDEANCYRLTAWFTNETTVGSIERAVGNLFNAYVLLLHDRDHLSSEKTLQLYNEKLLQIYQSQEKVQLSAFIWKNRHEEGFSDNTQNNSLNVTSSLSDSTKKQSLFKKLFSCC